MHTTAMRMCRPGVVERQIAGAIEGVAKSQGQGVSFPSIVSQHGETLHNLNADGVLEEGRLLLCDAGGETVEGYCSDHTRTYPVSGRFTQKQKDIYNIVLAAHDHVARIVKPHMMYTEVHNAAYMTLAEGLVGLGLLKGSAADAVAAGAMTMFMPHGLGHGLGMDVHDCEAMGERSFDYGSIAERAAESGTCVYRAAWRIEPGTVMTDEPGLYFIPALIDKCRAEGKYKGIVDYDALEAYRDFGGIRIEDDILVTESGSRIIGDRKIPVTVPANTTTMDKKWTIGLGLLGILIVFLLLWNFAPAIQRWLASVFVDIILLLAAFAAGWLFGRFGGKRRRSDDERNARNITQAQKK